MKTERHHGGSGFRKLKGKEWKNKAGGTKPAAAQKKGRKKVP